MAFHDQLPTSCAVRTDSRTTLPFSSREPTSRPLAHRAASSTGAQQFNRLIDGYGKPFYVPDYSINDIRQAIPKECFHKSGFRGLSYVARDIGLLVATFYVFKEYLDVDAITYSYLRWLLWGLYGLLNGLFGTGIWVLAHECGHQAFSNSKILNDTVGFILHSSLLVPYFSWKISHGKHHKGTAHMERDMAFVPPSREEHCRRYGIPAEELHEIVQDTPLYAAYYIITRLLIGWPTYLLSNHTGHDVHERQPEGRGIAKRNGFFKGVNHFNPQSPLFDNKDVKLILISDIGILGAVAVLCYIASYYGWFNLWKWYFVPYLWVNGWLVSITYLQHTDPSLPHYTRETWSFVRGATATIDRNLGFIGRHLFHGIVETHVLHHYVSTIPFYNAEKATEAIKPVMGSHYRAETSDGPVGFIKSLWRNVKMCRWVEPAAEAVGISRGVLFYRNRIGMGPPPKQCHKPILQKATSRRPKAGQPRTSNG
ncbi:oleate delta-12 desaturase [Hypoxylon crocopeplum]|nr:oleate delta-12 desaturase [Hypoxylon crocopeplum]